MQDTRMLHGGEVPPTGGRMQRRAERRKMRASDMVHVFRRVGRNRYAKHCPVCGVFISSDGCSDHAECRCGYQFDLSSGVRRDWNETRLGVWTQSRASENSTSSASDMVKLAAAKAGASMVRALYML